MRRAIIIVIASAGLLLGVGMIAASGSDDAAKHASAPLPSGVAPGVTPAWCLTSGFSEGECKDAYKATP